MIVVCEEGYARVGMSYVEHQSLQGSDFQGISYEQEISYESGFQRYPVSRTMIHLGIVCPMANEIDTAEAFVRDVLDQCSGFQSVRFFAVLDNVSRDGTKERLQHLAHEISDLQVVWAPENRSVVDAYIRGYKEALYAGCDWILEIDAGYSHNPEDIPQFFEKMEQGYDCVFGSRFCKGGKIANSSQKRFFISLLGGRLTNLLLGTQLTDMTSGFELFTRDALEAALLKGIHSRAHFFQTEIKVHCRNLNITEVPICYQAASPSVDNASLQDALRNLWRLFIARLQRRL